MEEITNVPVEENEAATEPKKKKLKIKLDRAEKFMILAVLVAEGLVPFATSLLNMLFTFLKDGLTNSYTDFMTENPTAGTIFYYSYNFAYNIFSSLTSSVYSLLTSVLWIIAVIVIAYFAYKKNRKKNAAVFFGVYFIAQNICGIFLERPLSYILNFISTFFFSLVNAIAGSGDVYDIEMQNAVYAVTDFVNSTAQFVLSFVCMIIMAALAVAGLRIINGKLKIKLKRKKKKGETEETTEEIQENA